MTPASIVFGLLVFSWCFLDSLADRPIKIIGAGFGRTGTSSLKLALNQLGYKTYHFSEMLFNRTHSRAWGSLWNNETSVDDVLGLVTENGYDAGVDWPISTLWAEVMERHPDAKVILSLRKNPEVWATSFMDTTAVIGKWMASFPWTLFFPGVGATILWSFTAVGIKLDPDILIPIRLSAVQAYKDWKKTVIKHVPAEKLLVWKPEDGWKPICEFLKRTDCPTTPFPKHAYDKMGLQSIHAFGMFVADWWKAIGFGFIIVFNVLLLICCQSRQEETEETAEAAAEGTPKTEEEKKED